MERKYFMKQEYPYKWGHKQRKDIIGKKINGQKLY